MGIMGCFLAALVPGAIFAVIAFALAKDDRGKLRHLLAKVSEDDLQKVKEQSFTRVKGGKKLYETQGLVASVDEKGEKSIVHLLFYNSPSNQIYDQEKKIDSTEVKAKGIKVGDFIPCLMTLDEEVKVFGLKRLI